MDPDEIEVTFSAYAHYLSLRVMFRGHQFRVYRYGAFVEDRGVRWTDVVMDFDFRGPKAESDFSFFAHIVYMHLGWLAHRIQELPDETYAEVREPGSWLRNKVKELGRLKIKWETRPQTSNTSDQHQQETV